MVLVLWGYIHQPMSLCVITLFFDKTHTALEQQAQVPVSKSKKTQISLSEAKFVAALITTHGHDYKVW